MSAKFVSKNSNYMVVLKPGLEGNRALGTHAIPGLYVKFLSGLVDVREESIIALMRAHPCFGTDFIEVKQEEIDPFLDQRDEVEPDHVISEIKYGHSENMKVTGNKKTKLTPALKKLIEGEAMKMLPGLLKSNPKVLKDIIMSLAADIKAQEEVKPAPKAKTATKTAEPTTAPEPVEDTEAK
jgi:hypothetical protein